MQIPECETYFYMRKFQENTWLVEYIFVDFRQA